MPSSVLEQEAKRTPNRSSPAGFLSHKCTITNDPRGQHKQTVSNNHSFSFTWYLTDRTAVVTREQNKGRGLEKAIRYVRST